MKKLATQHQVDSNRLNRIGSIVLNSIFLIAIVFFSTAEIYSESLQLQEISVADLVAQNSAISYIKCDDPIPYDYKLFPFLAHEHLHPHVGSFAQTFILKIPDGRTQSMYGWIVIDGTYYVSEMNWKSLCHHTCMIDYIAPENFKKVPGRVVVVGQLGYFQYWHWVSEILCRLAMIEMQAIEYDWLYIPYYDTFMKQTLELWGIDTSKIIEPSGEYYAIQADELIVPSLVSNLHYGFAAYSCYPSYHLFKYVVPKLLQAALTKPTTQILSKRIFISRKDAPGRFVINEDEVFALFEKQGFVRYQLSKMPISDQIQLFNQAEIVAGPAGTGITANSLYCKPYTKIIELFQALGDSTMWYVAQQSNLDYTGVQTIDFVWKYGDHGVDTIMDMSQIERVLYDLEHDCLQLYYTL